MEWFLGEDIEAYFVNGEESSNELKQVFDALAESQGGREEAAMYIYLSMISNAEISTD